MRANSVGELLGNRRKAAILVFVAVLVLFVGYITIRGRQAEAYFRSGAAGHKLAADVLVKTGKLLDKARRAGDSTSKIRRELRALRGEFPRGQEATLSASRKFRTLEKTAMGSGRRDGAREARHASEQAYLALEVARQLANELDGVLVDAAGARAAANEFDSAFEKANSGVVLANQNKFGEAKETGAQAGALYKRAITRLDRLRSGRIKTDLAEFHGSAAKGIEWAESVVKQAEAGAANNVSKYNKLVEQTNNLSKQVAAHGGGLQRRPNSAWVERYKGSLVKKLNQHTKMADKQWRKAIDLWTGKP